MEQWARRWRARRRALSIYYEQNVSGASLTSRRFPHTPTQPFPRPRGPVRPRLLIYSRKRYVRPMREAMPGAELTPLR